MQVELEDVRDEISHSHSAQDSLKAHFFAQALICLLEKFLPIFTSLVPLCVLTETITKDSHEPSGKGLEGAILELRGHS